MLSAQLREIIDEEYTRIQRIMDGVLNRIGESSDTADFVKKHGFSEYEIKNEVFSKLQILAQHMAYPSQVMEEMLHKTTSFYIINLFKRMVLKAPENSGLVEVMIVMETHAEMELNKIMSLANTVYSSGLTFS